VLRCSQRALDPGVGDGRRFALHLARADALRFLGRRGEQAPELEAALGYAEGDRELAQVLIEHAVFASRTGDAPTALSAAEEAVTHARASGDGELLAMARARQAFTQVIAGRFADAEASLAEAEHVARAASPTVRAFVSEFRGLLGNALGDVGMQVEAYREAVRQYEAVGDLRRAAGAENNVADAYNRVGAYADAESALRATVEKCRRVGNHLVEAYAMVNLGYALAMQGRSDEAVAVIREARNRAASSRDVRLDLFARVYLTRTRLSMAHAAAALVADADAAAEEAARLGLPGIRALASSLAARALLSIGDAQAALVRSTDAMRIRDELGSLEEDEGGVFLTHVRALEACGRVGEAAEVRARGRARLAEVASRIGEGVWRDRFRNDVEAHRELLS
jgi:tetratricopeptide (TPR) repeat protein